MNLPGLRTTPSRIPLPTKLKLVTRNLEKNSQEDDDAKFINLFILAKSHHTKRILQQFLPRWRHKSSSHSIRKHVRADISHRYTLLLKALTVLKGLVLEAKLHRTLLKSKRHRDRFNILRLYINAWKKKTGIQRSTRAKYDSAMNLNALKICKQMFHIWHSRTIRCSKENKALKRAMSVYESRAIKRSWVKWSREFKSNRKNYNQIMFASHYYQQKCVDTCFCKWMNRVELHRVIILKADSQKMGRALIKMKDMFLKWLNLTQRRLLLQMLECDHLRLQKRRLYNTLKNKYETRLLQRMHMTRAVHLDLKNTKLRFIRLIKKIISPFVFSRLFEELNILKRFLNLWRAHMSSKLEQYERVVLQPGVLYCNNISLRASFSVWKCRLKYHQTMNGKVQRAKYIYVRNIQNKVLLVFKERIRMKLEKQNMLQDAKRFRRDALLQNYYSTWDYALNYKREFERKVSNAIEDLEKVIKTRVLRELRTNVATKKQNRKLETIFMRRNQSSVIKHAFYTWIYCYEGLAKMKEDQQAFHNTKNIALLNHYFIKWKKFCAIHYAHKRIIYSERIMSLNNCFLVWRTKKDALHQKKSNFVTCRSLDTKRLKKYAWKKWRVVFMVYCIERQDDINMRAEFEKSLRRKCLRAWAFYLDKTKRRESLQSHAVMLANKILIENKVSKCFKVLQQYTVRGIEKNKMNQNAHYFMKLNLIFKYFQMMMNSFGYKKYTAYLTSLAEEKYKETLAIGALKYWYNVRVDWKLLYNRNCIYPDMYWSKSILIKIFHNWKKVVNSENVKYERFIREFKNGYTNVNDIHAIKPIENDSADASKVSRYLLKELDTFNPIYYSSTKRNYRGGSPDFKSCESLEANSIFRKMKQPRIPNFLKISDEERSTINDDHFVLEDDSSEVIVLGKGQKVHTSIDDFPVHTSIYYRRYLANSN